MIRNYLRTALRSLLKNKGFTFLNLAGLAMGLTICLLIILYVKDERSYDRYNTKAERIFRVNTDGKFSGVATDFAIAAPAVGPALVKGFPEVERSVRLLPEENLRFKKGNEQVQETKVVYSDPDIFDVFTLPMIAGDPATALKEPNAVVITESMAKKYFNRTDVTGQTLTILNDSSMHTITGVIRDIPTQSHFQFDCFLSMASVEASHATNFFALYPFNTYILLRPGADYQRLEAKFRPFMRNALTTPEYSYDAFEKTGDYLRINLIPLTDIHLRSNRTNELGKNGDLQYVNIFSVIALFILLIACINFMNLSTARSAARAREVGVRKVLGSPRAYLVAQFLSESLMVTFVAVIIAGLAAWALLPLFNQLAGKELSVTGQTLGWALPSLLAIAVAVGILSGSYPAFFLSSFQPIQVLKGQLATGFKGGRLRSFLVVFQFAISIFLIVGTVVIYEQLQYIHNKDLGFDRSQMLIVKNVGSLENSQALKQELRQLPGVVDLTLTSFLPTGSNRWHNFGNTSGARSSLQTEFWLVDEDYVNTMGMRLVKGRNFSGGSAMDSSGIILNETAARLLGWGREPLEKKISFPVWGHRKEFHVIGVVKDFNFNSLRDNITPLAMVMMSDDRANLGIRVNAKDLPALLARIENKWAAFAPHQRFEYSFMDEDFDAIYRSEQRMGEICVAFTSLAILIACLGLFGLAAYAAEQRTREIGIRKILGASVSAIAGMLSKDFIKLVVLAILIASPIAWILLHKWLQNFAYRVTMNGWVLAIAGLTAILIAFLTVIFQSLAAARANPVDSLRSE